MYLPVLFQIYILKLMYLFFFLFLFKYSKKTYTNDRSRNYIRHEFDFNTNHKGELNIINNTTYHFKKVTKIFSTNNSYTTTPLCCFKSE